MKPETLAVPQATKEEMRRTMRKRLRALSPAFHAEASLVICQAAARLPVFGRAKCLALFAPLPSEPDVRLLAEEAWAEGKRVAFPLMIKHGNVPKLDWHEVTGWDELVIPGPFGLCEPDPLNCSRIKLAEIDCAFVPGLAFDREGLRLGRGGGFYDAFLAQAPAQLPRLGVMFACQEMAMIAREAHDQALPEVLTEEGLRTFGATGETFRADEVLKNESS